MSQKSFEEQFSDRRLEVQLNCRDEPCTPRAYSYIMSSVALERVF